jgi:hypothetical protein
MMKNLAQTFAVATVRGEEFTFQSPNSEDIRDLDYVLFGVAQEAIQVRHRFAGRECSRSSTERHGNLVIDFVNELLTSITNQTFCIFSSS